MHYWQLAVAVVLHYGLTGTGEILYEEGGRSVCYQDISWSTLHSVADTDCSAPDL